MRVRKTVSVRLQRFPGGMHWYIRMETTGKVFNDVVPNLALAYAEVDRQMEGQFAGLKRARAIPMYDGRGDLSSYSYEVGFDEWFRLRKKRDEC